MLVECKMHMDVFVEAHIRFVSRGNNKKIKHGWQPSPEGTDWSPQSCSGLSRLVVSALANTKEMWLWSSQEMCFWQRSLDIAKLSSCPQDVTKCNRKWRELKIKQRKIVRFDGFLILSFFQCKYPALLPTSRRCPTRQPLCPLAGTNRSLAMERCSPTSCTTQTKALAPNR